MEQSLAFSHDAQVLHRPSLLRILEGVVVATQASTQHLQTLSHWFSSRRSSEMMLEETHSVLHNSADGMIDSCSVSHWLTLLSFGRASLDEVSWQLARITLAVTFLRELVRKHHIATESDLDAIWTTVSDAILRLEKTEIKLSASRSAQGFLAVPLCSIIVDGNIEELWRFHAWLPDYQRGAAEMAIHSHQTHAQSWILAGSGTDVTYQVENNDDAMDATHAIYVPVWTSATKSGSTYQTHQISSTVSNTGRVVKIGFSTTSKHTRDETYEIPSGVFHKSMVPADAFHATFFVFDAARGFKADAPVLGPLNLDQHTQVRDSGGIAPCTLARIAGAARAWEKGRNITKQQETSDVSMAYYRFFQGMALLRDGQTHEAAAFLEARGAQGPATVFAKYPTQSHREYLTQLAEVGLELDPEVRRRHPGEGRD